MKAVFALFTLLSIGVAYQASALTLREWAVQAETNPQMWGCYLSGVVDTIYNSSPDNMDYAECVLERARDGKITSQISEWILNEEDGPHWLGMPAPLVIRMATFTLCKEFTGPEEGTDE